MTKLNQASLKLAAVVLIVAVTVVFWWIVGDQTNEAARQLDAEGVELDYAIRPVNLGPAGERIVGVLACIGAIGAFGVLVLGTYTRKVAFGWWWILIPLVGVGAIVGWFWRVLTAGEIGANIGLGFAVIYACPLLVVLLAAAAVATRRLQRDRERRNHPS
ncbi:hypothetical protein [Micromonospora taraxaci]|uniref:hypothetical protein n=1 Tax=Micromonospora taraxaci TaxID=1316803 RepID=UPI00339E3236